MTASNDPSQQYVLPADAPLLANLAALWVVDPHLAVHLESLPDQACYRIEPSKSGPPTLVAPAPGDRTIYLHSRYRPLDEAAQLVSPVQVDERVAFHVQGMGLGYHLEALFDRACDDAIFFVFEPDLILIRTAMQARDLSRVIESGRVHFVWRDDKAELFNRLMPHAAAMSMGFEPLVHPPSLQRSPAFYERVQAQIAEFASYCRTTVNTLVLNGRRTAENVAMNLPWYVATPSLSRLHNGFRGKPAIVVSAGPSLRKNKHLLADAQGKAVIIAVQTMLQPMLEMGIEPEFVTSLDYHDICTRFFENLPKDLATELVAEPKATSAIFDMNPGPLSLLGNDFADRLIPELRLEKARLPSGATVAHLAYYLAEHLGCDPIIFIGQDLGFSDGLCYTPGTSYEDVWRPELGRFCTVEMKQWEQIVRDRHILRRVSDSQGRPTYTEERLFAYLQQFERDFAKSGARIIDATEGGVLKRGAEVMTFAQAIAEFCTEPLDRKVPVHAGLRWELLQGCEASISARREEAVRVEQISRETLQLLEQVHARLSDQAEVNRLISRIDSLRAQMNSLSNSYELIMQLTQKSELQRYYADRRIAAAKVDGIEKQRRQLARDMDNVRCVIDAAEQFQQLMTRVLGQIEHYKGRGGRKAAA
jgi:hypothetical protein